MKTTNELLEMVEQYKEAAQLIELAQAEQEKLKAEIKAALAERNVNYLEVAIKVCTTTRTLRPPPRPTACTSTTTTSTAGQSQAPPKSCWTSSSSKAGRTSRWLSGWAGQTLQEQVHQSPQPPKMAAITSPPRQRAAHAAGYAPSAAPSSAPPRKFG